MVAVGLTQYQALLVYLVAQVLLVLLLWSGKNESFNFAK
jgi:hypothetical protein